MVTPTMTRASEDRESGVSCYDHKASGLLKDESGRRFHVVSRRSPQTIAVMIIVRRLTPMKLLSELFCSMVSSPSLFPATKPAACANAWFV